MLKWFDSKEVDKFSDWLASEIIKRYPPDGLDADPKKSTQRLKKVLDSLFHRIESFAAQNTLNIYQKARLGNRVKWAMREAGYPRPFSESFTHEVVTVITVMNARTNKARSKR